MAALAVVAALVVGAKAGLNSRCNCERRLPQLDALEYGNASPSVVDGFRPANFDWSNVAGTNYLVPSWNQHIPTYCGSCYAHGTLASVQDRIKVAKGAQLPDIMLARQSFLNCAPSYGFGSGCHGGDPSDIFGFMHDVGLPDETCNNYVANTTDTCTAEAMCMNCMVVDDEGTKECWPVEQFTRYRVKEFGKVVGEDAIMAEVFQRGPVVCGFVSDEAFDFGYRGGVWRGVSAKQTPDDINHDVEVTGWGVTEEGVKFWQARNSWGTYWGEGGFFKIERGANLNLFESECYFAVVDVTDEARVRGGALVGSMYGLVEKPPAAARESLAFAESLAGLDWSSPNFSVPSGLPSAAALSIAAAGAVAAAAAMRETGGGGGSAAQHAQLLPGGAAAAILLVFAAAAALAAAMGAALRLRRRWGGHAAYEPIEVRV
ncbi:hypothetical protein JKP88DRAFT_206005 [Tribonema minus]|uniref:Peptidase C1A papain C-terminal domain-containing protein n=1 Tax=Tribonema minus TaxID=303371 RepID=A0A835ZAR1_9STRA|nr:hypothetical protein JKP88DRAFT_206005 [Tribonema minus]